MRPAGGQPLDPGTCEVWWASRTDAATTSSSVLSSGERERHARLRRAEDRDRFLVGRVLLRLVLARVLGIEPAAVDLAQPEPHGKPRLARWELGVEFSVAHSGERVLVAVAAGTPVGVDVEHVRAGLPVALVAPDVLGADEAEALARVPPDGRPRAFATIWTRKEAVLKATGQGLGVPLRSIGVTPPDRPAAVTRAEDAGLLRARLWDLEAGRDHAAALAVLGDCRAVVHRDGSALLATPPRSRREPG